MALVVRGDTTPHPEHIGFLGTWAELSASTGQTNLFKKTRPLLRFGGITAWHCLLEEKVRSLGNVILKVKIPSTQM